MPDRLDVSRENATVLRLACAEYQGPTAQVAFAEVLSTHFGGHTIVLSDRGHGGMRVCPLSDGRHGRCSDCTPRIGPSRKDLLTFTPPDSISSLILDEVSV